MRDACQAVKRAARTVGLALILPLLAWAPAHAGGDDPYALAPTTDQRALVSWPSPIGPFTYTPGRGLRLGNTGFTLGGYTNVNLTRDEGGPGRLGLDDLSFFAIWHPHPRVHFFSELEFENLLAIDTRGRGGTNGWYYNTERLFGDLLLSDQVALRLGKFLTPVGRWNVIHAQPLVWTTSRPLATRLPFGPHTTGALLSGWLDAPKGTLTGAMYGQFVDQLDPSVEAQMANRSCGARLEYGAWSGWSIAASYLAFSPDAPGVQPASPWKQLAGVDTLVRRGRLEVMGEFAWERGQWGLYVQPAVELFDHVYLVTRYEHYDQAGAQPTVDIGVAGLAWRPFPYLIVKTEYLFSRNRAEESPPGFRSSVALLF